MRPRAPQSDDCCHAREEEGEGKEEEEEEERRRRKRRFFFLFHRGEEEEHVREIDKTEEGGQSRYEAWYEAKAKSARGVLVPWALRCWLRCFGLESTGTRTLLKVCSHVVNINRGGGFCRSTTDHTLRAFIPRSSGDGPRL